MRIKILVLGLALIYLIGFVFAQSEKIILLGETSIVYAAPGETIYHLKDCEKLGKAYVGMTLKLAIKKGYKPCPFCIPRKKESKKNEKKIEMLSDFSSKKEIEIEKPKISQPGFRQVIWGMSQEQVKKIEENELIQKQYSKASGLNILGYKGKAGNLDCLIAYYFAENQLVEGRYIITEKHTNAFLYIKDFMNIKESLIEKYGEPTKDDIHWLNDLFKDDTSGWGTALGMGHVAFETRWKLIETEINLQCTGDNLDVTLIVDYKSEINKYKELRKKAMEKAKKVIWQ